MSDQTNSAAEVAQITARRRPIPLVSRVLAKGEPISAPGGRADDFSWPRTSGVNFDTSPLEKTPTPSSASVLVQENFVFEAEVR